MPSSVLAGFFLTLTLATSFLCASPCSVGGCEGSPWWCPWWWWCAPCSVVACVYVCGRSASANSPEHTHSPPPMTDDPVHYHPTPIAMETPRTSSW